MIAAMHNPAAGVLFWVGAVAIVAIFGGITYRVGRFALMRGEWRRIGLSWGLVLAGGLALTAAIPVLEEMLGWSAELTVVVFLGVIFVALSLTRRRRARSLAAALERQSPEVQVEYARRTAFLRSRTGRLLTVAMLVCVMAWASATVFIWAPPRPT